MEITIAGAPTLLPSGTEEMPKARLTGAVSIAGSGMNILALQVGFGPADGPFIPRAEGEAAISGNCIGAVDPIHHPQFEELHAATGSEGHLETVFIDGLEYAVFCYPFSI